MLPSLQSSTRIRLETVKVADAYLAGDSWPESDALNKVGQAISVRATVLRN
jgi:hypothetical protein